jgi:lysophospholipase L1-like esterase
MTRARCVLSLALLALALAAPSASAGPVHVKPPTWVKIGRIALGTSPNGLASILVPVRYPIQYAGRLVAPRVRLFDPGQGTVRKWVLHEALSSGPRRSPERRREFTFVHRIGLGTALTARLRDGLALRVLAPAVMDVNGDSKVELFSIHERAQPLRATRGPAALCSSVPRLRLRPGRRVSVPLPVCDGEVRWTLGNHPEHGNARIRHGRLLYSAPRRFRGSDEVELVGRRLDAGASVSAVDSPIPSSVQVTVGSASGIVVRALGDSVTAGFGYYSNGTQMTIGHLLECRPPETEFDDACSSNSLNVSNKATKVNYAPDYGLSNNVSWAAQWANEHGVTDYENLAVSGSEPADWAPATASAPAGELYETTVRIEAEDPDYILMTIGANPLLSNMLFGADNMGCAIYSDIAGGYSECIERAFREVRLRENLSRLYTELVQHTDATIYLMQYHLSIPSSALAYSAVQIAAMGQLLNREIETVAAEVNPQRLRVVTPPHFDVGIDISPVYPSSYSCSRFGYQVDGPSVQSTPTQDELEVLHPLSFCEGPAGGGPPWVVGGDTGIHPSAAGYAQMASQVPPPS